MTTKSDLTLASPIVLFLQMCRVEQHKPRQITSGTGHYRVTAKSALHKQR
jgi:hypothetical protein